MRFAFFCLLTVLFVAARGQSDTTWYNKGCSAAKKGAYKIAIRYFTKAIELDPEDMAAYNNRAQAEEELCKYKSAERDYTMVLERYHLDAEVYCRRGNVRFALGKYKAAYLDYQKATKKDTTNEGYKFNLRNAAYIVTKEDSGLGNYYSPIHQKIKDTTLRTTVSKFGYYLSAGIGGGFTANIPASAQLLSLSVAYKSHLLTATFGNSVNFANSGADGAQLQETNYAGLLIGECIRRKHFMASLSAGVAIANVGIIYSSNHLSSNEYDYSKQGVISFPIEVKMYYLSINGIGLGVHISENIVPASIYSPFYFGFSIITGYWNKIKRVKCNK